MLIIFILNLFNLNHFNLNHFNLVIIATIINHLNYTHYIIFLTDHYFLLLIIILLLNFLRALQDIIIIISYNDIPSIPSILKQQYYLKFRSFLRYFPLQIILHFTIHFHPY